MDGLHTAQFTGNLIAYSTGLLLAILLLVLTLRAARLPGTPYANIFFALCGVLWCGAGLSYTAMTATGFRPFLPIGIQYTAGFAVLVPVLTIWRARRLAQVAAVACAILTAASSSAPSNSCAFSI